MSLWPIFSKAAIPGDTHRLVIERLDCEVVIRAESDGFRVCVSPRGKDAMNRFEAERIARLLTGALLNDRDEGQTRVSPALALRMHDALTEQQKEAVRGEQESIAPWRWDRATTDKMFGGKK